MFRVGKWWVGEAERWAGEAERWTAEWVTVRIIDQSIIMLPFGLPTSLLLLRSLLSFLYIF